MRHATCDMESAAWLPERLDEVLHDEARLARLREPAAGDRRQAARGEMRAAGRRRLAALDATCDMRRAPCDVRHATCDMRHATCDMRHATCDMLKRRILLEGLGRKEKRKEKSKHFLKQGASCLRSLATASDLMRMMDEDMLWR